MTRLFFTTGAVVTAIAIAIGAATGHQPTLFTELEQLWLAKAIRYQTLHGIALLIVAMSLRLWPDQQKLFAFSGFCFTGGILLFSGSLYLLAFTGYSTGYTTPLGGSAFLAGWLAMAVAGATLQVR